LPFSALFPEAATGSTSLKNAASSARACVLVKPWPARLMLMTSASWRIENTMPPIRSDSLKLPSVSREARTAMTLVLPATPLPPARLSGSAAISPVTNVPWPTMSVTFESRAAVSKVRRICPANSGWFTSRPVSMTETVRSEPPPTAAIASPARTAS
jgi:hypothetical protein